MYFNPPPESIEGTVSKQGKLYTRLSRNLIFLHRPRIRRFIWWASIHTYIHAYMHRQCHGMPFPLRSNTIHLNLGPFHFVVMHLQIFPRLESRLETLNDLFKFFILALSLFMTKGWSLSVNQTLHKWINSLSQSVTLRKKPPRMLKFVLSLSLFS